MPIPNDVSKGTMTENKNLYKGSDKHPFSTDRPILANDQDLLGRSGFARSLSDAIKAWKNKDSLVIGVYGKWGSGKTSTKNMITDLLRQDREGSPTIVEFNPWQWAGQDQLFSAFFSEIGSLLGIKDKTGMGKQRAKKWRAYAAYLEMGSFLGQTLRKMAKAVFIVVGVLGVGGIFVSQPSVKAILLIVGLLAFASAALIRWGEGFCEKLAAVFEKRSEAYTKGLSHIKADLAKSLEKLEKPILVIMDDIDRLSAEETRLLFQLVKANADFPNMVYLLLFQRDIVEQHLQPTTPSGRDFLDKIVQVSFDLPVIERTRLEKVLIVGLNEILVSAGVNQRLDKQRWGNMFVGGLRAFFTTLREVHRYLGTFAFHVSLFRNKGSFEVNPIDLIALEVLRAFEPDAYQRIASSKFELTERRSSVNEEGARKRTEAAVESILLQAEESRRTYVRELVNELFPYTQKIGYAGGFLEQWFRDLRVCHPDVFDRYFCLTVPEGDVSQAELDTIIGLAGDRDALAKEFRILRERNLLDVALDRLEVYKQQIDLKHAIPFLTALFDVGDELSDEPEGFLVFGAISHAWRIVYWFLIRETDPQKREGILRQSMDSTTGLYLPIDIISLENDKHTSNKDPNTFLVRKEKLQGFIDLCAEKIRGAAQSGSLAEHKGLISILYRWRNWTSPEEPSAWVHKLVESETGAVRFLVAVLQKTTSQGMGDYVPKVHWMIRIENIENFVPSSLITEKIQHLDTGKLNEQEQRAVRAFQMAIRRKERGISDDAWRLHEDDETF